MFRTLHIFNVMLHIILHNKEGIQMYIENLTKSEEKVDLGQGNSQVIKDHLLQGTCVSNVRKDYVP